MKRISSFLAFYFLTIFYTNSLAQNIRYKKRLMQPWKEAAVKEEQVNPKFLTEDAVILYEKTSWKIRNFEETTVVNRNVRIKFLTQKGIDKHSRISIPESIDSPKEYADVAIHKRQKVYRPKYFDLRIIYFNGRLIREDGTVTKIKAIDTIEQESLYYNNQNRFAYAYHFDHKNIQVGDVLEIDYQYSLPFIFDWRRIFFHGQLPKQQTIFELNYPAKDYYVFDKVATPTPTDSTMTSDKKANITLTWEHQNLPAALAEVGSRPYEELPHIQYYVHNKDYGNWNGDKLVDFLPYGWKYVTYDLIGFKQVKIMRSQKLLSKKQIALNRFLKSSTANIEKKDVKGKIYAFHQVLLDDFTFKSNEDYYMNVDSRLAVLPNSFRNQILREMKQQNFYKGMFHRLLNLNNVSVRNRRGREDERISGLHSSSYVFNGLETQAHLQMRANEYVGLTSSNVERVPKTLEKKRLQDVNRHAIYEGLLNRFKNPYYIALLADKRVASIKPDNCMFLLGEQRWYNILIDSSLYYIYPKKERFGYAINEIPFYRENTINLQVSQMTDSYFNKENVRFFKTPASKPANNFRQNMVKAKVNLANKTIDFEGKINLSGQFSTLTRGFYQYGYQDSTVNERYYHTIYTKNDKVKLTKQDSVSYKNTYPFKATTKVNYKGKDLVTKTTDSTYTVNINHWIHHIIETNFRADNRTLAFYSDFEHKDSYAYQLVFDKAVQLRAFKDLPLLVDNEFGRYSFDIQQTQPTTIVIQSTFTIKKERTPAEKANLVEALFEAVKKVEKADKLSITLVE